MNLVLTQIFQLILFILFQGDSGAPYVAEFKKDSGRRRKRKPTIVAVHSSGHPIECNNTVRDTNEDEYRYRAGVLAVNVHSHMEWILSQLDRGTPWQHLQPIFDSWRGAGSASGAGGKKRKTTPSRSGGPDKSDPGAGPSGEKRKKTTPRPRSREFPSDDIYYDYSMQADDAD